MNNKTFSVINPSTGTSICDLDYMGYNETTQAINNAKKSFLSWKSLLPQTRADIIETWYNLLKERRQELAEIVSKESGKPVKEALGEVDYANSFVKYYSQEILRLFGDSSPSYRQDQWFMNIAEPIGIVGAITPWNFPAAMITKKIAPALAAGCPVILKPSEETPLSAIKIRELALQAGVPSDVFGMVYGDAKEIGRAIVESLEVKMISFTGSVGVGKYLMEKSANTVKKLVLELGGNAPCVVMKDADLNLAAERIAVGKFRNAGQACTSPNRIFVHETILENFIESLITEISDNKYEIGPLINQAAKKKTEELVEDSLANGAKILFRCKVPVTQKSKTYFAPIILGNLNDEMRIIKEEAFSPIFSILTFKDKEELIDRANNTEYGLAAYLFSSDLKSTLKIANCINFGVIGINETMVGNDQTIHGGFNDSGLGREGGKPGLMEYYENKFIIF